MCSPHTITSAVAERAPLLTPPPTYAEIMARGGRHLILALRSVRKKVGSSWRLQTMTLSQQLGQEAAKDLKKLRFPELHETIDWVQNLQKWFHCHVSMASI